MFGGPFRRFRKFVPVIFLLVVSVFLVFWIISSILIKNLHRHSPEFDEDSVPTNPIKVIIGHYVGPTNDKIPNATWEMINRNNFNPVPDAGMNGNPVIVQPKDLLVKQQLFQINRFNLMASDQIPLNRSLPDVRRKMCARKYSKPFTSYPTTSVIIVFHNEAWSTLLRTVWTVVNRSNPKLLEEIILVDDASEREFLKKPLDDYLPSIPAKIKLLRSTERIGLIKARLKGAKVAKGEVLTFLDAHCECTKGWLDALLYVIKKDRKTVVCPVIDIINDETFAYTKSFELHFGAFNWNLQFRWYTIGDKQLEKRKQDATEAFETPAMAGGLFSIDKKFFFEIGSYDEGMNVWGGENLEMSFRIWQCGGTIQIAPCSHVGHIFRKSSPYSFPGGIVETLFSNLARVAMVWMDDWGEFYFKLNKDAKRLKNTQNVTQRLALRNKLQCKDFEWYLDNVWPQHFFPKKDRFFGKIRNVGKNLCLMRPEKKNFFSNQNIGMAKIETCLSDSVEEQMFVMTNLTDGFIMTDDSLCLDAQEKESFGPMRVRLTACSGYVNRQKWKYRDKVSDFCQYVSGHDKLLACSGYDGQKWKYIERTKEIVHVANKNKCLDTMKATNELILAKCNGRTNQKWIFKTLPWR